MSEGSFLYDIFLSHNNQDEDRVRLICNQFHDSGLKPFFAPIDLREHVGTAGWEEEITRAVVRSQHLGVYCSRDAVLSEWVRKEVSIFVNSRNSSPGTKRLLLPLVDPDLSSDELQQVLAAIKEIGDVLRPRDSIHALETVVKERITHLVEKLGTAREELNLAHDLARQAFEHYRHARFWRSFSNARQDLHIFTCGRDTPEDLLKRGPCGRTSIDRWDYQAAVDITHHFGRYHRDVDVVIEDPVSKAQIEGARTFDRWEFGQKLFNRNCVIIGSPDVSDFAEIAIANLLKVDPYYPDRPLSGGFRIRKGVKRYSTFYEQSQEGEDEGISLISEGRMVKFFHSTNDRDHGIMILADNPFTEPGRVNKILILAGHSGVATRAMSLLLTNEERWCLEAFYDFDRKIAVMEQPLAAVVEVSYQRRWLGAGVGDDREIVTEPGSICVREVLPLAR